MVSGVAHGRRRQQCGSNAKKVCCGLSGCLRRIGTGAEEEKKMVLFFSVIYFFVRVLAGKMGSGQQVACGFVPAGGFSCRLRLDGSAFVVRWVVRWVICYLAVCCL